MQTTVECPACRVLLNVTTTLVVSAKPASAVPAHAPSTAVAAKIASVGVPADSSSSAGRRWKANILFPGVPAKDASEAVPAKVSSTLAPSAKRLKAPPLPVPLNVSSATSTVPVKAMPAMPPLKTPPLVKPKTKVIYPPPVAAGLVHRAAASSSGPEPGADGEISDGSSESITARQQAQVALGPRPPAGPPPQLRRIRGSRSSSSTVAPLSPSPAPPTPPPAPLSPCPWRSSELEDDDEHDEVSGEDSEAEVSSDPGFHPIPKRPRRDGH